MIQVFKEVSKQENHTISTYELLDAKQDAGGVAEVIAVSFHPFGRYLLVSLTTGKAVIAPFLPAYSLRWMIDYRILIG